jgi:enoyl-CoA hydratase/carnithine racemase
MDEAVRGLRLERRGALAIVVLDRPARRNAVTLAMWRAMTALFSRLERDAEVRGVVLTGAENTFSAGGDILEFDQVRGDVEAAEAFEAEVDRACDAIAGLSKPTAAAISGVCYGGACHLAMACDFRLAAADARFAIPAAKLSVVYSAKGLGRLLALVGLSEAKRIMYGGEALSAGRAREVGLVDEVVETPLGAAEALLNGFEASAPLSLAASKAVLNALAHPAGAPLDAARLAELNRRAVLSRDYAEARRAFAEKRPPRFEGR